ncbi:MAG: hypothetical protein ACI9MC_002385 [Kiritimatiellia bacterium]|jgi:hypothetical protein
MMLVFLWLSLAQADSVAVCGEGVEPPCFTTIQLAVDAALDGDTITIPVRFYDEAVVLRDRDLTLASGKAVGQETNATITGAGASPPITVSGGELRLRRLTLNAALSRAMITKDSASVTAEESVFTSNGAVFKDGGVIHSSQSKLDLDQCEVNGGRALQNGGSIYSIGGQLTVRGTKFKPSVVQGGHAGRAGGLIYADDLQLLDTNMYNGTATLGGAVAIAPNGQGTVTGHFQYGYLEKTTGVVRENRGSFGAAFHVSANAHLTAEVVSLDSNIGAAIFLTDTASITISKSTIIHNEGPALLGVGEAGSVDGGPSLITQVLICDANSPTDTLIDGANIELRNSFITHSTAVEAVVSGDISLVHNHIVGNTAARLGNNLSGDLKYNLVAHNHFNTPVHSYPRSTIQRNLWWANQTGDERDGSSVDKDPLNADPLIEVAQTPNCDDLPTLYPSWYGAAHHGVTDGDYVGDGLPMLGAWGGIDNPFLYAENGLPGIVDSWRISGDTDIDGVSNFYDCDRTNSDIAPGVNDPPYDGVDSDCGGNDDFDFDQDGHVSADHGGDDCDDSDPRRSPSLVEVDNNGVDDDCDGWADAQIGLAPRTCGGTSPYLSWSVLFSLLLRRQRGTRRRCR